MHNKIGSIYNFLGRQMESLLEGNIHKATRTIYGQQIFTKNFMKLQYQKH